MELVTPIDTAKCSTSTLLVNIRVKQPKRKPAHKRPDRMRPLMELSAPMQPRSEVTCRSEA